jgi:hypothetical protein
VAAASVPTAAGAERHRLVYPQQRAIARAGPIRDTVLRGSAERQLSAAADWGGTLTASTGESVTIRFSSSYAEDAAVAQRWAEFFASLVHGPELATVDVYLAPLNEVEGICGGDALACYSSDGNLLIAPGEAPSASTSAEAVVTHEYGHHVAASRSDTPWRAVRWGTKRWSSYEHVCARAAAGELFPGAEQGARYAYNPGEAFAEAYRVLNERLSGRPETPWEIVTRSLYPDSTALALLQQDVVDPWAGNATVTAATTLSRRARVRTIVFATPLDGMLRVTVRAHARERVRASVLRSSPTRTITINGTTARTGSSTVCGARTVGVRLTLLRGSGPVTVAVSRP